MLDASACFLVFLKKKHDYYSSKVCCWAVFRLQVKTGLYITSFLLMGLWNKHGTRQTATMNYG